MSLLSEEVMCDAVLNYNEEYDGLFYYAHFSSVFRHHIGCTPSVYKKRR